MKKIFAGNKQYFDDPNNIKQFSKEDAVRKYVDHMKLLELKREKRAKEKAQKDQAESKKNYNDYDWKKMFHDGSLGKLKVAVLDKYLNYHNLGNYSNKKLKLEAINMHITRQLNVKFEEDEEGKESEGEIQSEESDSEEYIEEIGLSDCSDNDDNVTGDTDELESPQTLVAVYTKSGRRATRFKVY